MSESCPIAYDHTDDLDECRVCGWSLEERPKAQGPRDLETLTGPERIREAIKRLSGGYAPTQPIKFACRPDEQADPQ